MTRTRAVQPRRVPQQARSRRQWEKMLDAAADVFAELGYDAATTNAIAERAGISIGSLYQFFPNKAAIFNALTSRYLAQSRELLDRVLTPDVAHLPLDQVIDQIVDAFWERAQGQRGFIQIVLSARLSPELAAQENALIAESVQRTEALLHLRAPHLDAAQRTLIATVAVDTINALLGRAATSPAPFGAQVIAEGEKLLYAYLNGAINDGSS